MEKNIINLKSKTIKSSFYIVYKGSTELEIPGVYGISHLMEHLMCHALSDFKADFDKYCINDNAYTSASEIVFYISGHEKYLSKYRDAIIEKITNYKIPIDNFETERKIVLEEYSDYMNNQNEIHINNLFRKKFNSFFPIGLKSDIEKLTYNDIINYQQKLFSKPSMIINISKNYNYKSNINFNNYKSVKTIIKGNYNNQLENTEIFKSKSSIILYSDIITEKFPEIVFILRMLSDNLISPLYDEIREKRGLAYSIGAFAYTVTTNSIIILFTATTSKENKDEIIEAFKYVLNNPNKFMTKKRFNNVKKSLEINYELDQIDEYELTINEIINEKLELYKKLKYLNYNTIMNVYKKYFMFNNFESDIF